MKNIQTQFADNEQFGVPVQLSPGNLVAPQFQFRRNVEHIRGSSAIFLISLRRQHKARSPRRRVVFAEAA